MNIKKIGLTALAGSLVATSAFAGAVTVAGGASMGVKNNSGTDGGKSWTMGNQLTFTGGGELDNGLNVSISFVLDQGDNAVGATKTATTATGEAPFDSHSITVSSDELGSITMAGEGASSAQSALDTTAAGDIFDNGFGISSPAASDAASGSLLYTLPSIMDDLSAQVSYSAGGTGKESSTAFGLTYTGVDGLSASYGSGELGTIGTSGDATTMKASYAVGSFTAAISNTQVDYDATANKDQEVSSFKVSYTVTEDISISYGEETLETDGSSVDEEVEQISASYTTGGMTISLSETEATGIDHSATSSGERWKLGVSFAF
jgi:outer membrane protein OmpU